MSLNFASKFSIAAILFSLIFVSLNINVSAESTPVPEESSSPEAYSKYLESKTKEFGLASSASDNEAKEALDAFNSLNRDEQERYLSTINDPEILKDIYQTIGNIKLDEDQDAVTEELYGGYVKVTMEINDDKGFSVQDTFEETADVNTTVEIAAVNVVQLNIYMQYTTENDPGQSCCTVSSVNSTSHAVVQNYIPIQTLNATPREPYISGDTSAIFSVLYTLSLSYNDISVTDGSFVHQLTGTGAGSSFAEITNRNLD
ncbi:hypothetical protein [Terribacillus saccharophilus]|uniref:hypothetical protein n=1 Tax=Terribacillus saccharophilus TaxID=361277 RepID=UPI003D276778